MSQRTKSRFKVVPPTVPAPQRAKTVERAAKLVTAKTSINVAKRDR